ncbi:hypothetical protein [[Bacillus] enclensis]|uniref:hypothetical protein n=1 Tax=[Bacillus] enclensis TaxID=1402860 RepID=UPI0018DB78D4|nr:hypothetical protein [[Bacillus] enclensis]MBH9968513.1 hypothetical protein [[Bacillus] enclensis]
MKIKFAMLLLSSFVLLLSGCSTGMTSTTSDILIKEKDYSEDFADAWIMVVDPNDPTSKDEFKIKVQEPMVWNLIEEGKTYFSSYTKKGEDDWVLEQIEHVGDGNAALR